MQLAILCVAVIGFAGRVAAGNLIVDEVPASVLASTNAAPVFRAQRTTSATVATVPERWEKFEAEFGIQQPSRSLVKGSLQNAKYRLDEASVTLQEFVDTVRDRLKFDYGLNDPGSPAARRNLTGNLLTDTINRARLQSAIDLNLGAKAFLGVKLVLPLGD